MIKFIGYEYNGLNMQAEPISAIDSKENKNDSVDSALLHTPSKPNSDIKKYLLPLIAGISLMIFFAAGYAAAVITGPVSRKDTQPPMVKDCAYDNKIYKSGASFTSSDGCNSCSCGKDGQISCTAMACEDSTVRTTASPIIDSNNFSSVLSITPVSFTTYKDEEFGYQVTYNANTWMFRHTYGKGGISNSNTSGTPRIISGFDLHKPSNINSTAIIVLSVFEANNETDIDQWIKKYDLNSPKNASSQLIVNQNFRAREYTYSYDSSDEFIRKSRYFINKDKAFRLNYSEIKELSKETIQIVETFKP